MTRRLVSIALFTAAAATVAPAQSPTTTPPPPAAGAIPRPAVARALETITAEALLRDMRELASDRFQGRAVGTPGEDSAVAYIAGQMLRAGLTPGSADGSFIQRVPLVGTTSGVRASATVRGTSMPLRQVDDIVAWSQRADTLVAVNGSELVFVG